MSTRMRIGLLGASAIPSGGGARDPYAAMEQLLEQKRGAGAPGRSRSSKSGAGHPSYSSLSNKQDPRCGILHGMIVGLPERRGSSKPKDSQKGGSIAGGSAGTKDPLPLIVSLVDLMGVNVGVYNDQETPACPLFSRDQTGRMRMLYSMSGRPIEGRKGKTWSVSRFSSKMEFSFKDGDTIWVNVFEYGVAFQLGDLVKLTNLKLTKDAGPKTLEESFPGCPEFSTYYFNCSVVKMDEHPFSDLPLHSKFRRFWPTYQQFFPNAKEIAHYLCQKEMEDSERGEYSECNVRALCYDIMTGEPGSWEPEKLAEILLARMKVRCIHFSKMTPTYLLIADGSERMVPCCDEYDPMLELAARKGTWKSELAEKMVEDISKAKKMKAGKLDDWEENYFLLNKAGSCASINWPNDRSKIHIQPQSGPSFISWEVCALVTQWGYPGCLYEEDFDSPLDPNCSLNLATGLIQCRTSNVERASGIAPFRSYRFSKVSVLFKITQRHMGELGPLDQKDLEDIILSHKIPFDVLLEIDNESKLLEGVGAHIAEYRENKSKYGIYEGVSHLTQHERSVVLTEKAAEAAREEASRWTELEDPDCCPPLPENADGGGKYYAKLVSWRLADYLMDGEGIHLPRNLTGKLLERVPKSSMTILNPHAIPNDTCSIFLNPKSVAIDELSDGYDFYALVCFSDTMDHVPDQKEEMQRRLSDLVQRSKAPASEEHPTEVLEAELYEYLRLTHARVFYYAVDMEKWKKCKEEAKRRDELFVSRVRQGLEITKKEMMTTTTKTTTTAGTAAPAATTDDLGSNLRAGDIEPLDVFGGEEAAGANLDDTEEFEDSNLDLSAAELQTGSWRGNREKRRYSEAEGAGTEGEDDAGRGTEMQVDETTGQTSSHKTKSNSHKRQKTKKHVK